MMNKIIIAAAGGRKTQDIVDSCSVNHEVPHRCLVVTYTTTGQGEINRRLIKGVNENAVDVMGWYGFLLNHFIYPYLSDRYPSKKCKGLYFVEGADPSTYRRGEGRYFDDEGLVFSTRIGKLADDILKASKGSVIDRLERIYNEIFFDEVQDLTGNDLDILEALMKSKIQITAVGDIRQSILTTTRNDQKNKQYKWLNKKLWFELMEKKGLCQIEHRTTTWRCNQLVIDFADSIFPAAYEFPPTTSLQDEVTSHDGIFVVKRQNLERYLQCYNPQAYRHNITAKVHPGTNAMNFKLCKGLTVPRVLIYPTGPINSFLLDSNNKLTGQSASEFYVAITRAVHSVAFVIDKDVSSYPIREWIPDSE